MRKVIDFTRSNILLQDNSLNKLYNQVEAQDQGFPGTDLGMSSQPFGDSLLGHLAGKSLLESFGQFNLESAPSGWPTPAAPAPAPLPPSVENQELGTKSPMKFPSQVLTQNSRASPFSDTTESSLFSNSSSTFAPVSRLDLQQSQFSSFSSSSLLASAAPASHSNSFGLSDLSSRLEQELSQGSVMMSQGASTRDSTPLSWNPVINYSSSKTSSLTSSPTMSQSKTFAKPAFYGGAKPEQEDSLFSEDEDEKLAKLLKVSQASHQMLPPMPMTSSKPKLLKSMSTSCVPESPCSAGTSWSQIVRTSSSKLPSLHQSVSPVSSGPVTRASLTPSPPTTADINDKEQEPQLVVEEVPPTTNTVDFHRGPKVDPRWPVAQQVFLGPIPMSITWDEIRNVFYTKVQRRELLHFYVQSKPVNEVVYGQVVFDKAALANKVVKVRVYITFLSIKKLTFFYF